jgi:RNA-directed DNA polymerase
MAKVSPPLRPQWNNIPQDQFRNTFRQLQSLQDLADFWGLKPFQLSYYAFKIDKANAYTTILIPRRNGRDRRIEAPIRTLKFIQRLIHESLTRVYGPHPAVHGFRSGRSIITNAQNHTGRQFVLNIDF